jgi:histidine triad (HIT) family protein
MNCLFCDIATKKIPAEIVYESELILAFKDIAPKAPSHLLIIPKKHMDNVLDFTPNDGTLLTALMMAIKCIAEKESLSAGFRIVTNTGKDGGQTVKHIHFHLLGGRPLKWPPG